MKTLIFPKQISLSATDVMCTHMISEQALWLGSRGGRPQLIIHKYAVTFSGRGCGRVAEVAETQVLEARLACEGRLWMNHRENHEVWTLLD